MAIPSVIDVDSFLAPFEGENPSGQNLKSLLDREGKNVLDLLAEAQREEEAAVEGGDSKRADWNKVFQLSSKALKEQGKDIDAAVAFARSAVKIKGWAAIPQVLQLVRRLHENFWDTFYPKLDEEDWANVRVAKLTMLEVETSLPLLIRDLPILPKAEGKEFSWLGRNLLSRQVKGDEAEKYQSDFDIMTKALANGKREFFENLYYILTAADEECAALKAMAAEKYAPPDDFRDIADYPPNFDPIKNAIGDCMRFVREALSMKGGIPGEGADAAGEESADGEGATGGGGGGGFSGSPGNRAQAIAKLREVAEYFRVSEPHNPAAPLVLRAAKWAEMPLEQWLAEVVKDPGVLGGLHELLGIQHQPE